MWNAAAIIWYGGNTPPMGFPIGESHPAGGPAWVPDFKHLRNYIPRPQVTETGIELSPDSH